jgi:hypothetical protein
VKSPDQTGVARRIHYFPFSGGVQNYLYVARFCTQTTLSPPRLSNYLSIYVGGKQKTCAPLIVSSAGTLSHASPGKNRTQAAVN